jgi:hypothetical protein
MALSALVRDVKNDSINFINRSGRMIAQLRYKTPWASGNSWSILTGRESGYHAGVEI